MYICFIYYFIYNVHTRNYMAFHIKIVRLFKLAMKLIKLITFYFTIQNNWLIRLYTCTLVWLFGVNVIINKLTLIPSEKEQNRTKRNSQAVNNCYVNYYYSLKIILNTLQICCASKSLSEKYIELYFFLKL